MDNIGIVGFGRFGKILAELLKENFSVKVHDISPTSCPSKEIEFVDLPTLLKLETIFIAVPISQFTSVIREIAPQINNKTTTIIDVCSVKIHPVKAMQQYLPSSVGIIATHPMFGPDSFTEKKHLKMMMHNVRDSHQVYDFWKNYFINKNIKVIEMAPEQHDHLAAYSQGITHFVGRVLNDMQLKSTAIDTQGFSKLLDVIQQTCHDTWELFADLQCYNPYTHEVIEKLIHSTENIRKRIEEKIETK